MKTNSFIIHKNRSRNCDTDWILCHISMASIWIPFKPQKKHSYDSYSIYIVIFSSFLQGVYPVGVTDLRPYFTRIIAHNSVNVHRIPTKRVTEIRCNAPFKCANFQLDWSTNLCSMTDFAKCAKSRRKNPNF